MQQKNIKSFFPYIPALLLVLAGGLFALYFLLLNPAPYQLIESGTFLDRIAIPFDWIQIGPISFPLTVDNYLIFQEYYSFPSAFKITESYLFAGLIFLLSVSFLAMLTDFQKLAIVAGGIGWIVLLTICNFNGLNIGGVNSNFPLILVLVGSLGPVIIIHIWGQNLSFLFKWIIIALCVGTSIFLLSYFSNITFPLLYISEYTTVLAIGLSIAWMFWNGHSFVSGSYILLAKINQGVGVKISYQIAVISLGYLALLFLLFMEVTGSNATPFLGFSPFILILPVGILGWFSLNSKIEQVDKLAASSHVLKTLHLMGFGLVWWTIWKLILSGNQPGQEFLKHIFLYTQIGFSMFFIIYLFSNFLSIMDSGKAIDKILFKPYSLPYYHLRIGGLMTILVLTIYAGGIISTQLNALTNNLLGDYYYQSGQKLEASILYENSWAKYRRNNKAKNLTAQLLFQLNQPSLAKQHLEESFAEYPQVDNIILLSNRLHQENKIFEAIFYLEKGLEVFPGNPVLANNLALFYLKINQSEKALETLENLDSKSQVEKSNLAAIKTRLGKKEENPNMPTDLIGQINQLAINNASGNYSNEDLIQEVKSSLETERRPMIIHAGWRNLFSEKDRSDPSEDLKLLDTLGKQPTMVDYLMDLQETSVIRSLGAGRVSEAVKNLNGLAFRNPGSAGYYLNLSFQILAQNLDFKKAAKELIVAEEKGFKAFQPHHLAILTLAGFNGNAEEIRQKYEVMVPNYLSDTTGTMNSYLGLISKFHESFPQVLYSEWNAFPDSELKTDLAIRLLVHKSHGLDAVQIQSLGQYLNTKIEANPDLSEFLSDPSWQNEQAIDSFSKWLGIGEDLTANPYFTPLILAAAEKMEDPLEKYELLNEVSLFNHDPLLWIEKIRAAKNINLDRYAQDAINEMKQWIPETELEKINF